MRKNIKKTLLLLLTVMCILSAIPLSVKAAGSVSASAGKTSLEVGETTTFSINANQCGGKFTIHSSDTSVISISGDTTPWVENGSHSVTLTANKAGRATITVDFTSVADSVTSDDITGSKSVTIEVKEKPQAPDTSSATLKSITVAGKNYPNPSRDFTVTVGADVTATEISAVANNGNAKISGTGSKELRTGTNTVTITVTGGNGASLNYTIRIRRLADTGSQTNQPNEQEPDETQEQEPDNQVEPLRLKYLMIDDVELMPNFDAETFEYFTDVSNVDKLEVIANANDENAIVEIEGNDELKEGENTITITLTRGEGEEKEETVYTITVTKKVAETVEEENTEEKEEGFFGGTTGKIVIAVATAGGVVAVGIIIWKIKSGGDRGRARRARHSSFDDFND